MRTKLALVALLGAAAFLPVAPASAICTWSPDPVFGTCNPCQVAGIAYGTADHALNDKLPSLDCIQ